MVCFHPYSPMRQLGVMSAPNVNPTLTHGAELPTNHPVTAVGFREIEGMPGNVIIARLTDRPAPRRVRYPSGASPGLQGCESVATTRSLVWPCGAHRPARRISHGQKPARS